MSEPLKPCPFCGTVPDVNNPATFRHETGDRWAAVVCCIVGPEIRAGFYTPIEEWKDEAIAAWNKRMTYSHRNGETEPPTVEGWYWFQGAITYRGMQDLPWWGLVAVPSYRGHVASMRPHTQSNILAHVNLDETKGRWWGPIEPPWLQADE